MHVVPQGSYSVPKELMYETDFTIPLLQAVENVFDTGSEIADIYALKTSHLSPKQTEFFKKWEALISMEEQDMVRFRKELWTMGAQEREEKGRCFSSMVIDPSYENPSLTPKAALKKEGKIHQFTYRMRKVEASGTSLLNGHMSIGDAITVSVEPDLLAFSRGFILELTPREVVIGIDHDIDLDKIRRRVPIKSGAQIVFRIDKDELSGGMARVRDNLARLFYVGGDTKRLELVVDLRPPVFEEWKGSIVPEHEPASRKIAKLNDSQQQAMKMVLSAQDYALILGMPGTGKTTVIATIIDALVCLGKTVLLTSYTHSAVDNILMKLMDEADYGILRLGNVDKVLVSRSYPILTNETCCQVHPDVQKYTLSSLRPAKTIEELERQVMGPPVVATTCLTIDQ